MICSILLAYLKQIGRRDRFRDVWIGVISAVVVAMVGGVWVYLTLRNYDESLLQTRIEGVTYFIAMLVLTYMTFWMKQQGKHMKQSLQAKLQVALQTGSFVAISLISFVTVGREGLETVIFMIAIAFHTNAVLLLGGALTGLACGLTLSILVYVLGRRVNLKVFFDVMGTLLMLFAAGLLANGVEDFQALHWFPNQSPLWNSSSLLGENTTMGDIMHSFFGYADQPTLLQVTLYLAYIILALLLFWRRSPANGSHGDGPHLVSPKPSK